MTATDQAIATDRLVVECRVAGTTRFEWFSFDCAADVDEALRWQNSMRRVGHVDMERSAEGWSCSLNGIGHRLPVHRRIPLRVGLGLAELGIPVVVRGVRS